MAKTDENMAKEEDVCELEEVSDEPKGKKVAKHDAGAADLEKVTDYVEEAEISSQNISDVSMIHNNGNSYILSPVFRMPKQAAKGKAQTLKLFLVSILQTAHLWANTGVV